MIGRIINIFFCLFIDNCLVDRQIDRYIYLWCVFGRLFFGGGGGGGVIGGVIIGVLGILVICVGSDI